MLAVCAALAWTSAGGDGASFADFDARARRGDSLSVVFLGGSLTFSANASDPNVTGVRGLVARYLASRYPAARFSFHDAAIGGTGSLLGAFRLERDVFAHGPDIVFLDFLCNDGTDDDRLEATCAYEYILREIVGRGVPVEQMFFTFKFWAGKGFDPAANLPRRNLYLRLAEAYGTPFGDVHLSALARDLESGKTTLDEVWPIDAAHPADLGYRYFFEAVREGFERGVAEKAVCRVPAHPVFGTMKDVRRTALCGNGPLPKGWTRTLAYRTSMWFDGLPSRWMGDVASASVGAAPLRLSAECNFFACFGEGDEDGLAFRVTCDGAPFAEFPSSPGPGRLFVFRSKPFPEWWNGTARHEFEIEPVAAGKGELHLESVMTATLVPADKRHAADAGGAASADIEALDHGRGRKTASKESTKPDQADGPSTFCNPLSIPDMPIGAYCRDHENGTPFEPDSWSQRFWNAGICNGGTMKQHREIADPVTYVEGSTWYLYPSLGLLWKSENCGGTWERVVESDRADYAPAVARLGSRYYLCTSFGHIRTSDSPIGPFTDLGPFDLSSFSKEEVPGTGDPALLADDGRLYLYWGCCAYPKAIWVVELDPENPTKARGEAKCLMEYDEKKYPWLNELIEGPWVFRRGDTYYLCYATGNTINPDYVWCCSKGSSPTGPFTPQRNNPFFATTRGLVTGTSHGSIWRDADGEWWINYCIAVSAYHGFERMIGQDRLCFDEEGDISVGSATSTPQWLPSSGRKGDTGWKRIGVVRTDAWAAADDSIRTWYAMPDANRSATFFFAASTSIRSFRVIWRDLGLDVKRGVVPGPYRYRVERRSGGEWTAWLDATSNEMDLTVDYREAPAAEADAVRIVVTDAPKGITPALADFSVFGIPGEKCR